MTTAAFRSWLLPAGRTSIRACAAPSISPDRGSPRFMSASGLPPLAGSSRAAAWKNASCRSTPSVSMCRAARRSISRRR